jgi:hypothetical protein
MAYPYGHAKNKINQGIREGKSDEQIRKIANDSYDKASDVHQKIATGFGALGGGLMGHGLHELYGKPGNLRKAGAVAAGSLSGAALDYYASKFVNKKAKPGINENAEEAIRRRKEMRKKEGR